MKKYQAKFLGIQSKQSKTGKSYYLTNLFLEGLGAVEEFLPEECKTPEVLSLKFGDDIQAIYSENIINSKLTVRLSNIEF